MYKVSLKESCFPAQKDTPFEPMTIGALLARQAAATPDVIALNELDYDGSIKRAWTYAALLEDATRLAKALANRHEKGTRIAVWAHNLPEWVLLEFASAMAGVTLVTVNPAYQARELEYVLKQSRSEAIYYVEEYRGNPMQKIADEVCAIIPEIKDRVLLTDHEDLFRGEDVGVLPEVDPYDPAQIQYTSGTTGFPKGALLHHAGLVQNALDASRRMGISAGARAVHHMPLFHTTGCAVLVLGQIGLGCTFFLAPVFDPEMIARVMAREKVTCVFGVPTMIVALIEQVQKHGLDVSSIQCIGTGGAMVAPELVKEAERVLGAKISIVYGQTETSPVITGVWPDDSIEDMTQTIGQPAPHTEVSIRDTQTNKVVPIGEQGEICCRGYQVMLEYNDNPEATAATIDGEKWLHTGDLGRMDSRGFLKITGRVKEMIIRGGENLFPAEIENAMLEHSDIAECAVVGVADKKWGEQVACFMRSGTGNQVDAVALKTFVRDRLSPQKTPAYWVWVDDWPLTGSGKIRKFLLAEQFEAGQFTPLSV